MLKSPMYSPHAITRPAATYLGLIIVLLVGPGLATVFRLVEGDPHSDPQVLIREFLFFALTGLLLWIVKRQEGLPLASIGLHLDRLGRSLLRGLLLTVIVLVTTIGLYFLLKALGVPIGGNDSNPYQPSLWVLMVILLRAGIVEEIFSRGYAIERLQALTGNKWIAGLVPLVIFSVAHYRQGMGGVIAVFILGGITTVFYMKLRDLAANITGHFLGDFVLNVLLPLVSHS
jgi:membrane protease YdiL (CAAX protease family)